MGQRRHGDAHQPKSKKESIMTDQQPAFTRIEATRGPRLLESSSGSPESETPPSWRTVRVLVVANTWCRVDGVCAEVRRLVDDERYSDVLIIAPALAPRTHKWTSDLDQELKAAQGRLDTILTRLQRHGVFARGHVADTDPILAFQDALVEFSPDRVMLVTEDSKHQSRQEREVFSRMIELFPVASHVAVAHEIAL